MQDVRCFIHAYIFGKCCHVISKRGQQWVLPTNKSHFVGRGHIVRKEAVKCGVRGYAILLYLECPFGQQLRNDAKELLI